VNKPGRHVIFDYGSCPNAESTAISLIVCDSSILSRSPAQHLKQ